MNHYRSFRLIVYLVLTMSFLTACGATVAPPSQTPVPPTAAPPSQTPVPPTAGTYLGGMEDGSTLRVVLVLIDNQIQVQEVGYFFAPTGIEVKRVFLEGNKSFGEVTDNILTFQLPVMMGFFGPIQYYDVELSWDKPGELHCMLKKADPKGDPLKFQMENLSIDATKIPAGASMKDNYELILKP
jgi:hypothetical protein